MTFERIDSILRTGFVELQENMTIAQAFEVIRNSGIKSEIINTCYVTDLNNCYIGCVELRRIIIAKPENIIGDITNRTLPFGKITESRI
ncbi:MAG: hypothetical protein HUK24_05115 [Sphaerochaetaceae bacterium]|nr:hypothetical protein [Sphaerochaetaceae bacterium]